MKAADFRLDQLLEFRPAEGRLMVGNDRMLLFRQDAFANLRRLLFDQLGESHARAILSQFGYQCGHGDFAAMTSAFDWDSEADRLGCGPAAHSWEGIVAVTPLEMDFDRATGHFYFRGKWENSYEAEIHRAEFGLSKAPVCFSLTGYASGWCSAFFGHEVLAIETQCMGKGDPHCEWVIRNVAAWGSEAMIWRDAMAGTGESIARELEEKLELIRAQEQVIHELASPIIHVWDGVLALPVIGLVDSHRAAQMTDRLLQAVAANRAKFAIIDLTGVDTVDTATANHLFKMVMTVRLLGGECLISGISPTIARMMCELGVDTQNMQSFSTLQNALGHALRKLGVEVRQNRL